MLFVMGYLILVNFIVNEYIIGGLFLLLGNMVGLVRLLGLSVTVGTLCVCVFLSGMRGLLRMFILLCLLLEGLCFGLFEHHSLFQYYEAQNCQQSIPK